MGVVTIGVALPTLTAAGGGAGPVRDEAVLRAATGRLLRVYPAAQFGGVLVGALRGS